MVSNANSRRTPTGQSGIDLPMTPARMPEIEEAA
jgi:hypothetical protein